MTLPTISTLPTAPSRGDAPSAFNAAADNLMAAFPTLVSEINAFGAALPAAVNGIDYNGTSTTSLTVGTGSKSLTTQTAKNFQIGQFVIVANTATPANYMTGQVTAYNSGTGAMTVNVTATGGAGTFTAWTIALSASSTAYLALSGGTLSGALTGTSATFTGDATLGTSTSKLRLTVASSGTADNAPVLGTAKGIAYLSNSDQSYGLCVGTNATDKHVWFQAQRTDATGTAYAITLNEGGGNVGVGVAAPTTKFQINSGDGFRFDVTGAASYMRFGSANTAESTAELRYDRSIGRIYLAIGNTGSALTDQLRVDGSAVSPGPDNGRTLGDATRRWSTVYAATSTINTSDEREKQWRGEANVTELRAAKRIIGELGFYRWIDAVVAKGDDARLHYGVRAQRVWAIMAEEGLIDPILDGKPGRTPYAFLCYDEWGSAEGKAGTRFGIRADQLALFLVAGLSDRIAALEA